MDVLLEKMFTEEERWTEAVEIGVGKDISKAEMRKLCDPEIRKAFLYRVATNQYRIAPPHMALIRKDTPGEFRTVYVNENIDRIFLSLVCNLLFELFPDMIHPACKSYQKGIGCGKVDIEVSKEIVKWTTDDGEYEAFVADLTKYFDSVIIELIDAVFDKIEERIGKSVIISIVREYYHTDLCFDTEGNLIHHYQSLKQGCAVASFLADVLLYDIDEEISKLKGKYVRYSDDCLYVGPEMDQAMNILKTKLAEKTLSLNPKKVKHIDDTCYFKFLGFAIRGDKRTLSEKRVRSYQEEIDKRTINSNLSYKASVKAVLHFLYGGKYSWASLNLPIINVEDDIDELNKYAMDALRAMLTGKKKIGGLGYVPEVIKHRKKKDGTRKEGVIVRGKGKHVAANRKKTEKKLEGYMSIRTMRNAYMSSHEVYDALVRMM